MTEYSASKYLILCAGAASRWPPAPAVPKQLIEIEGETLVDRTSRLLREHGADDISLIVRDNSFDADHRRCCIVDQAPTGTRADKFLSSRDHWSTTGDTVFVFGDVWFSEAAIRLALRTEPSAFGFVGRASWSRFDSNRFREIFTLRVPLVRQPDLIAAMEKLADKDASETYPPAGWWLYGELVSQSQSRPELTPLFYHIDDFTEDFDRPAHLENWITSRKSPLVWVDPNSPERHTADFIRARRKKFYKRVIAILIIVLAVCLTLR